MSADETMYDELLGAFALDAVDDDERRAVEQYLRVNPQALTEVRDHREVATMLAWTTMAPPDGLWERIAASIDDEAAVAPRDGLARVLPLSGARGARRWLLPAAAWVAASAAAAAVAVVVVGSRDDEPVSASPLAAAVAAARDDRGARFATIESSDRSVQVPAVIDAEGHGFLEAQALPALGPDRTYQLWGVIGEQVISLGVLGSDPAIATFAAEGDVSALVITTEVAGGVVSNGNPDGALAGTLG